MWEEGRFDTHRGRLLHLYSNGRTLEYKSTRRNEDWTEMWAESATYKKNGEESRHVQNLHFTKHDVPATSPLFVRKPAADK